MEYAKYVLQVSLIALLFAIPGILIDAWMVAQGIVRSSKIAILIGVFCLVLIKTIWFPGMSWLLWGIAIILSMTLVVHRGDLWVTMKRGRRWWEKIND
jgi:hypothetical protein